LCLLSSHVLGCFEPTLPMIAGGRVDDYGLK
jgi:hypothetical protein